MALIVDLDLNSIKMNQHAKYVKRHSLQKLFLQYTDTLTHPTNCFTWATKVVCNNCEDGMAPCRLNTPIVRHEDNV